jgi:hypothetical protein
MVVYDDGQSRILYINEDDALLLNDAFTEGKTHVKLSECAIKLTYINFIQELEVQKEKEKPAPSDIITIDLREYPDEYREQMRDWLENPEAYSMGGVDIG